MRTTLEVWDAERLRREFPIPKGAGSFTGAESTQVLALLVDQGLIFPGETCVKTETTCRRYHKLVNIARSHGIKLAQWHSKGQHIVVRTA